ncbi:hypothetical protein SCHPADRAFT_996871 [Schizopora paradoxa]|uniref:F-box domain-containing protein n=1 Tax=Schizopora paradoxa TaxID=27342 RepID=A0A0H2RX96_9AGAM|nr:hypothetical protein SCHPADRAFT_996871 [Schizopora paradoxa]
MEPQEDDGDGGRETSPAPGLERQRIHPEVISAMLGVVERLGDNGGRIGTLSDLFDVNELWGSEAESRLRNSSQSGKDADSMKVERSRRREDTRDSLKIARNAASAFVEIGNHVFSQARILEERLEAEEFADRVALLSLPDEILAIIFKIVVDRTVLREDDTFQPLAHVHASVILSHVCQRFRHIATSTPYFWNRTLNVMPTDMVEMCFDRLLAPTAEVAMTGPNRGYFSVHSTSIDSYKSYLSTVIPFSRHWRRYTHEDMYNFIDGLTEVASLTRDLNAPHLSSLSIAYSPSTPRLTNGERSQEHQDAFHYFSSWSCPSLVSLVIANFVPVPYMIPNSSSLKKLDMKLCFGSLTSIFSWKCLASFLSSLSQLEELSFTIEILNLDTEKDDFPIPTEVELSRVRELEIVFYRCNAERVDIMFTNIRLPNLASLKICAWGLAEWEEQENIDAVIRSVIPDERSFPKLAHFELGLGTDNESILDVESRRRPICTVCIPFASLTLVNHFTIVGTYYDFAPLPGGSFLPSLRSLTLKDCKKLNREWIIQLLSALFKQKSLHPSQLKVEDCMWTKTAEELKMQSEDEFNSFEDGDDEDEGLDYRSVSAEEMIKLARATN